MRDTTDGATRIFMLLIDAYTEIIPLKNRVNMSTNTISKIMGIAKINANNPINRPNRKMTTYVGTCTILTIRAAVTDFSGLSLAEMTMKMILHMIARKKQIRGSVISALKNGVSAKEPPINPYAKGAQAVYGNNIVGIKRSFFIALCVPPCRFSLLLYHISYMVSRQALFALSYGLALDKTLRMLYNNIL